MSNWLRFQLELDAASAIDLDTNEQILHVAGRHIIVLLGRLVVPLFSLLLFGGFALYRATGGGFVVTGVGVQPGFDFVNWLFAVVIAALSLIWVALLVRGKPTRQARIVLGMIIAVLALLIYFRSIGGRIFYHDPQIFVGQAFDWINLVLLVLTLFSGVGVFFVSYDWLNDELILTNQRVIFDDDQVIIPRLLERRQQQQIFLEDVQDVSATTETYAKHLLGYGTIRVKSARINGDIVFASAREPMLMQQKIMGQVRALRKAMSDENYVRLVADHIYGQKAQASKPSPDIRKTTVWRWLNWLIPNNPEIDEQTSMITWRPHWLFLFKGLIGPFVWLTLGSLALVIGAALLLPSPLLIGLGTLFMLLVFFLWAAWEWEDYRNDLYILTPEKLIDIEKKPFGPEDRREAGLGAVNNISSQTSYISNLLGYGDVVVTTAGGGGAFTFERIPRPRDVVAKITEYNVRFKRADKNRSLNDMLGLLRHYHDAQLERDEINRPTL
ncbi:MAG: PH domain-containing protein [Candidatus Viridilinea halotolerans]|uniref:PH domain-containing protein n=1 Tax=Candidatus Viridilinea halotolerans TaxID=2491704 RepID=A0A426TZ34_9CHLR|nr:MAG: PH domain-containing protein [Candidatus Viridilinea halotolerans]